MYSETYDDFPEPPKVASCALLLLFPGSIPIIVATSCG